MITFTIDTLTPCLTETSTGEIFETEVKNGINPQRPKYSKDAAQSGYAWAMLNGANDNDSMENWAQLLRMTSENVDEGSLYRNVMQTADLLSQIAEMAQVGAKESVNVNDKEYYSNLKDTAHQARNLILQKPAEM